MAVGDIYQVSIVSAVDGQRCVNVVHFGETTACTDTIPAKSVCAMYEDIFLPLLCACMSDQAKVQCIYARRIRPTFGIPFLIVESISPGLVDSDSVPPNAAAVISFYTATATRSGRGRQYISGIPESRVTDSLMDPPAIGALEDYADAFINADHAPPSPMTGEFRGLVYSPKDVQGRHIVARVVSPSMGSMRSRRQPYGMTV